MKQNIRKCIYNLLIAMVLLPAASCRDFLDTSSDQIAFENENQIKNPNDLFYSIAGILAEAQKTGDRYVFWGELRGDLMTTSDDASLSLKEINNFEVSSDNVLAGKRDFYNVINQCNYALQKIDTTQVDQNTKVMLPGYVEIKVIRAWTYFQMAQIFGKATYFENPILDLESSLKDYPVLSMDAIADKLIADLSPYQNVVSPSSTQSPNSFVPVQVMLADLYLYQNSYAQAARLYYNFIAANSVVVASDYTSRWTSNAFDDAANGHRESYQNEAIASILYNTDPRELHSQLVSLSYNDKPALLPTQNYISSMSLASYFYTDKLGNAILATTEGDLRGRISLPKKNIQYGDAYSSEKTADNKTKSLIYKYLYRASESSSGSDPGNGLITNKLVYLTRMPILRIPHLYLRYAEAVNRAGKPTLAFAALKYGLTNANLKTPSMVNPSELAGNEAYLNFSNSVFDQNIPMAARGRGLGIPKDTKSFVIPDFTASATAHQDSINWVEDRILDETAAETPFEGNRFFDLLRVSRRRPNHPEYMAGKVSVKYTDPVSMKAKLSDINAWFAK